MPPFLYRVSHSVNINLSSFGVDEELSFNFIDPTWAWIVTANKLPVKELHWFPAVMHNMVGERVYGAGVQHGKAFHAAFNSCPEGGHPMLINLHWDGTSAHGIAATPIGVGVVNYNGQGAESHACVGYMPTVETKLKGDTSTEVKFYIRQQCIGAILSVLEIAARTGVTCRIHGIVTTLFPRLIAMTLDQPENQLYFGQLNAQSCLLCRRRKGRSAHRKGTSQSGSVIQVLYSIVEDSRADDHTVKLAKEKLARYGLLNHL